MDTGKFFGKIIQIGAAGHNIVTKGNGYFLEDDPAALRYNNTHHTLIYISSGQQTFIFPNDVSAVLSDHSFIFFPANRPLTRYNATSKTVENYYVTFSDPSILYELGFRPNKIYYANFDAVIISKLEALITEHSATDIPLHDISAATCFIELMIALYRSVHNVSRHSVNISSDAVTKIAIMAYNQFNQNLSLDDYAAMCGISKYHFCRVFKKNYGLSPIAFRNKSRCIHSCDYLENTNISINQIASLVGFSNANLYIKAFSSLFKITPAQYRAGVIGENKTTPADLADEIFKKKIDK